MAPVNIAGQPMLVAKELRRQGIDATLLEYTLGRGHPFGYEGDRTVDFRGRHRMGTQIEVLRDCLSAEYDLFHFWMAPLFNGPRYLGMYGLDLAFLKARGEKIIYRGTGFDLRVPSKHMALNKHHPFQYGFALDIDEATQETYLKYLRDYVDLFIVQDPEMQQFMPDARIVPRAIDLNMWSEVGVQATARPLIVHAPSKAGVKGTAFVKAALSELRHEGVEFEFKLVSGMRHVEAMEWYRRADIIVDQLLLGWYGVLTVEGLSLGKPVITYIRDDLYNNFSPEIPIENANPMNIKEKLHRLIIDFERRRELSRQAREFVSQIHDVRRVGAQLKEIYMEVLEMPSRSPEGFGDLEHFLQQFTLLDTRESTLVMRSKARRFDQLADELPVLRAKARRYDELVAASPGLKSAADAYVLAGRGGRQAATAAAIRGLRRTWRLLPYEVRQWAFRHRFAVRVATRLMEVADGADGDRVAPRRAR